MQHVSIAHVGKARMIQHNDSDTSCMRALALLERTFASEAELPPATQARIDLGNMSPAVSAVGCLLA